MRRSVLYHTHTLADVMLMVAVLRRPTKVGVYDQVCHTRSLVIGRHKNAGGIRRIEPCVFDGFRGRDGEELGNSCS